MADKPRQRKKLPRAIKYLIAGLLIAAAGLFVFANRESLSPSALKLWFRQNMLGYSEGNGEPAAFPGTTVDYGNFVLAEGNRPALVSDTSFALYRSGGALQASIQHGFSSPSLRSAGDRFLLFNLGGKTYRIGENDFFRDPVSFPFGLYGADLAKNGNYVLLSGAQGFSSMATVLDSRDRQLFRWASQDYLLSACDLSDDGTRLAAAGFGTQNGDLISQVSLFRITEETPDAVFLLKNLLPVSVTLLENGSVMLIGDTAAAVLNPETKSQTEFGYKSAALSCSAVSPSGGAVVALSSSGGRNASVTLITPDGASRPVAKFADPVVSLDICPEGILVLSGGKLTLLNEAGTVLASADAGSDAQRALYSKDGSCFVLGLSELRRVELQNTEAGSEK